MLKKIYRLKEREVKKVLGKTKPFFSYGIVLNYKKNTNTYNRFSIVIWWKSVNSNVTRTFFRRVFFDFISDSSIFFDDWINKNHFDCVFVVKKQMKLDKRDKKTILEFKKDMSFLEKKFKK